MPVRTSSSQPVIVATENGERAPLVCVINANDLAKNFVTLFRWGLHSPTFIENNFWGEIIKVASVIPVLDQAWDTFLPILRANHNVDELEAKRMTVFVRYLSEMVLSTRGEALNYTRVNDVKGAPTLQEQVNIFVSRSSEEERNEMLLVINAPSVESDDTEARGVGHGLRLLSSGSETGVRKFKSTSAASTKLGFNNGDRQTLFMNERGRSSGNMSKLGLSESVSEQPEARGPEAQEPEAREREARGEFSDGDELDDPPTDSAGSDAEND